jgi:putative transposase
VADRIRSDTGTFMTRLLQPLFALFATTTDDKLRQMVEYLQEENKILRAKLPQRITLTNREKTRLIKLGTALGGALKNLVTIVSYRTFTRWRAGTEEPKAKSASDRKPGRPRTVEDVGELVLKIARENGWGYTRVLGELKKLGVRNVSRSTVVNILREAGLDPGPKRGKGTWDDFITRHATTLWACDFLSVRSVTLTGCVDLFALFFIHLQTRRVIVTGVTANPDSAWVTQQARNATMDRDDLGLPPRFRVLDHDTKFTHSFDAVFEVDDCEVKRVGPATPNLNSYAERWVLSAKTECLDHFLILGERHFRHLLTQYAEHHNLERPHQARGNVPLPVAAADAAGEPRILPFPSGEVKCRQRLGGLLKHYYRAAA